MTDQTTLRETPLAVVGAGPGGYAAAFAAADLGIRTVLVDCDPQPGGVCLNRGCIPSKALLHVARLITETREASHWGLSFEPPRIDLEALRAWKNGVIQRNATGIRQLARARGVEIIQAWARFEDSQTLLLSTKRGGEPDRGKLRAEQTILAVGSRPSRIPALEIGSPRVIDSTGALELQEVPATLLVVGGGYIGLEMGTVYAALGSRVTVVEMTDGLLPGADRDLVRILQNRLKTAFHQILLQTRVTGMQDTGPAVEVTFEGQTVGEGKAPAVQSFERVLVSVGRTPNSDGLGLENTGVKVNARGFIEIDRRMRTADPHILAIGDVAGEPMLAHKASKEGKVAAEVLAGHKTVFDARAIPGVVFTDPEVAWVGLTEARAAQDGIAVEVGRFPWGASGRAAAMGRNDGLTKIITDPKTRQILGVGIVGVGAGELIAEGTLAIEMGATAEDVGLTIHAHPTLSETVAEAAELAYGTTTHLVRPAKR